MQTTPRIFVFPALAVAALLAGTMPLAAAPRPRPVETITYSSGTCFSGCPVERIAVRSNGRVTISTGGRGRSVTRFVDPAVYRDLAASLRPYRPATGTTAQTACARRDVDEAHYRISWIGRGRVTTLEHDYGCGSPRNAVLNGILVETSSRLGAQDSMTGTPATITTKPALPKPHIFYF